jgi:hypothetical protein
MLQAYGIPLDSRTHITKTDWSIWSATLADQQHDFTTLIAPIHNYLNQTTARSPLVDSYTTDDVHSDGMHARPVIGAVFIKALTDRALWKKWAGRDRLKTGGWMPLPQKPEVTEVIPTSKNKPQTWCYTTKTPENEWFKPGFDDHVWQTGPALFGKDVPSIHTPWSTADIWLRRVVTVPPGVFPNLKFFVFHDEDVEIYANGILAGKAGSFNTSYEPVDIRPPARALFKPGAKITLAVHCHQTVGGQGIDVGLANVIER